MKNTIFFLAVIFVLQSNTFMFGQSNSLPKNFKLIPIHQIDLVSAEMMSIVCMMLEKPNLLNRENEVNFALKNNLVELKLPFFEVNLEMVSTNQFNQSNWNALNFPTVAHKSFLSTASIQQFEDLHAINSTQDLRRNIFEPLATNISLQKFVGENVTSIMQPTATFLGVELADEEWTPNGITSIPTNNVQIRNWKGQIGVGVGSYY
jgi:hypothetical protein